MSTYTRENEVVSCGCCNFLACKYNGICFCLGQDPVVDNENALDNGLDCLDWSLQGGPPGLHYRVCDDSLPLGFEYVPCTTAVRRSIALTIGNTVVNSTGCVIEGGTYVLTNGSGDIPVGCTFTYRGASASQCADPACILDTNEFGVEISLTISSVAPGALVNVGYGKFITGHNGITHTCGQIVGTYRNTLISQATSAIYCIGQTTMNLISQNTGILPVTFAPTIIVEPL